MAGAQVFGTILTQLKHVPIQMREQGYNLKDLFGFSGDGQWDSKPDLLPSGVRSNQVLLGGLHHGFDAFLSLQGLASPLL